MTALAPEQGALRARLDEDELRRLVEAAGRPDASSPADAPGAALGDARGDARGDALGEAVRLALGGGAVRVEVATWTGERAVQAHLAADRDAAAGAARAGVVVDGAVVMAPGVEVSAFPVDRTAVEVLRLFPPDVPTGPALAPGSTPADLAFTLPPEAALMMSRALREDDDSLAVATAELAGLDEVPRLLESLSASLRGDATVTVAVGDTVLPSRRWLLCHLGWVAVAVTPGGVTHHLVTRGGILDTVLRDLVTAWEVALGPRAGGAGGAGGTDSPA